MNVGNVIYSALTEDAAVSAIIGTRCFPMVVKSVSSLPRVCYDPDAARYLSSLDDGFENFSEHTVDVYSFASSYDGANTLAEKVREAMDQKSGTIGSIDVEAIYHRGENDDRFTIEDTVEGTIYGVAQTYELKIRH